MNEIRLTSESTEEEVRRLQKQVNELQAALTAKVEASRARRVRAFHERFGHPISSTPHVPDKALVQFRLNLIAEEFFELLAACEIWPREGEETAADIIRNAIQDDFAGVVNLPEVMDALEDLDYVVEGFRTVAGVDGEPIAKAVHEANMAKLPNGQDKPRKPSYWREPNIRNLLLDQGWDGT